MKKQNNNTEFLEMKKKLNLKTLYPYTNDSLEKIELILNDENYCGILFPVCVDSYEKEFRILRQNKYRKSHFDDIGDYLLNWLECLEVEDKTIFLSVVDLFDELNGKDSSQELRNLELLKEALYRIYDNKTNIIINNSIYDRKRINKDLLLNIVEEFPNIDCAYTTYSRDDDVSMYNNIVPELVSNYNMVTYINSGKRLFLPCLEIPSVYRKGQFEELLGHSFDLDQKNPNPCFRECDINVNLCYTDANITVISKENADLVLKKVIDTGV